MAHFSYEGGQSSADYWEVGQSKKKIRLRMNDKKQLKSGRTKSADCRPIYPTDSRPTVCRVNVIAVLVIGGGHLSNTGPE